MCNHHSRSRLLLRFFVTMTLFISIINVYNFSSAQDLRSTHTFKEPTIRDPKLKAEKVMNGFNFPTGMAFLGPDDILIIEKNTGKVKEIKNGAIVRTILDVNVANDSERGLLGIAISKQPDKRDGNQSVHVFLYYTENKLKDGEDPNGPLGNRLYKYEYVDGKLISPKLLLDLPTIPGPSHNGGALKIGSDKQSVYLVIGNVNVVENETFNTKAQNNKNGPPPDGRGGVLRITFDGGVVGKKGVLGNEAPLNKYYAYGIRNSFGIDFDPVTGNLWDTENGPEYGDEINLVEPGFNSGWNVVQGIWEPQDDLIKETDFVMGNELLNPHNRLVDFGGKGKYSSPEFTWNDTVGPTGITFLSSDKLGKNYENDMFVGTTKGYLYHFDLNKKRSELALDGTLSDKVANNGDELRRVSFARDFGLITALEVGPDGCLYVLSGSRATDEGAIYRIVPIKNHQ